MYQLNSYAFDTHTKWIAKNYKELILPSIGLAVSLLLMNVFGIILVFLVFIICGATNLKTRAKKKLVYTARVKRLITTNIVIITAILVFTFMLKCEVLQIVEAAALLLAPAVLLLSNLINMPVEKLINLKYINEAKRILRDADSLKIIGITGSYGKTSVKYFLSSLLQAKYDVLKTPGNYNTTLGVVKTIREMYSPLNQVFVCEMGARRVGDIKEICDLVHPDAGIITSIGPQHLETFKTLRHVQETKYELADSLDQKSPLFLNGDDENIMSFPHRDNAIIYGIDNHQGYFADSISTDEKGSKFLLHTPEGDEMYFTTQLLGRHNVLNIVGAIAIAHTFGITLKELVPRVRKLEGVEHRLQFLPNPEGAIIDDAYNSNPQGTKAALEVLSLFEGFKVLVTPGMVELGSKETELNYEFGQNAASVCDYIALVGEQRTKPIYDGIISTGYPCDRVFVAGSFNEAMQKAKSVSSNGKKRFILLENDLPDNY